MQARGAWTVPGRAGGAAVAGPLAAAADPKAPAVDAGAVQREVTALFDAHRRPVLRYLLSIGLAIADAEDVAQETFLALFNHLRRGRPRTNLPGWVFRTAHNLGLKKRRLVGRARAASGLFGDPRQAADTSLDPEARLAVAQRYERMCAALRALPERDRFCLSLRAEGLRYREIAKTLGISLGSVSNSMRRAAARLQEADR